MLWHQSEIKGIFEQLKSSSRGLSSEEAGRRLREYGPNELKEKKGKNLFVLFIGQFTDFMILVLIAAAVIAGIIGEPADAVAIVAIVVINAIIGFIQEYRAERAVAALKKMAEPVASVLRDGVTGNIPAYDIVPGDIVILEAGRSVPADIRLAETAQLKIEEAALTGESIPSEKTSAALHEDALPLGDRKNMAYKGTVVSHGRGRGIVVSTGMGTEIGRIAAMLQEEKEVKAPLQRRLAAFGRRLAFVILAVCAVVFAAGVLRGEQPIIMFLTAVSLAVAAVPEALPAVVTISLAIGARKMVRQNVLIRKLPAIETLGSVTYICSDKTGTLTLNKMTVEEVYVDGKIIKDLGGQGIKVAGEKIYPFPDPASPQTLESLFFTALALGNDAVIDKNGNVTGDPTERALFSFAAENGFDKSAIEKMLPRIGEIPFDSERKCMTTFHGMHDTGYAAQDKKNRVSGILQASYISFTKGAIEVLTDKSDNIMTAGGFIPIDKKEIHRINEKMAADGLRVLGIAMKRWGSLPEDMSPATAETGLTLLGLVGMMDPPREEVKKAVAICREAGIRPVMITGDHPVTAWAIAKRIGLMGEDDEVMTGKELEGLSHQEFGQRVEYVSVYARVAPEQKLKIVKALQDKGQFVAMTGDGVNDAPALKRADIGISMGISGTDAAKESAHMILMDDNFASIVGAVIEGRRIYDNIRKFIRYLLSSNSGEIWTLFLAPLVGLPVPLLPIHILWINLMTDGLPALALSAEPAGGDTMRRPPRDPKESIFAHGLGVFCLWAGLLMAGVTLSAQAWSIGACGSRWQTIVFTVLCLSQFGNAIAVRSEKESLLRIGLFTNKPLIAAILFCFALQMATIYLPALNPVFRTEPLPLKELMFTITMSSVVFFAVELEKLIRRKRWLMS